MDVMHRLIGIIVLALLVLGLTACQSGLGKVSPKMVELYDVAAPEGMIEVEINRDGTIREMEADINVADLPAVVKDAALKKAPKAKITGAEREFTGAGPAWEVQLQHEGRNWEYVIDGTGKILETEKELKQSEAPPAVIAASKAAVPGGQFKSVEVITTHDGVTEYHVKKLVEGVSYKIVMAPDGTVKRKVREHKAEIEIPLR